MGAVQAQDYGAAKWAVGQRVAGSTDASIEQAVNDGAILRTHVLRPTWHFVAPADIRWLLALTGPRVNIASGSYYRRLELDEAIFKQTNAVLEKALQGGKALTRPELVAAFEQAGINTQDLLRFTWIIIQAELAGLICNGARQGKLITYALLEERVPPVKPLTREEALAEITRRYFTSHGPATLPDFVWWSGLTTADARAGLNLVGEQLEHEVIDGQTYWFKATAAPTQDLTGSLYLLPNFDEYTVSYKDRSAVADAALPPVLDSWGQFFLNNTIVINGLAVGTWKRTFTKTRAIITIKPFRPLNPVETEALNREAERFGRFMDLPVTLEQGV
jgi:hypothetical protein